MDQATIDAAVSEYRTYVLAQSDDLIKVIDTFTTAVDAGDLAAAKAAYGPSRVPWERVEPIAELFADLDPKIDAREDDFQAGVDDPEFTGYHKIEQLLFAVGTTEGTAELTAGLRANVAELRTKLETLEIDPRVMTQGAGVLIDEVAQSKMTGEEDRYSKLDLWSIGPNLEGSAKIVDILRPTLEKLDTAYLGELDGAYASVTTIIDRYGNLSTGFKTFDQVSAADRKSMQAGLAEALGAPLRAARGGSAWKHDRRPMRDDRPEAALAPTLPCRLGRRRGGGRRRWRRRRARGGRHRRRRRHRRSMPPARSPATSRSMALTSPGSCCRSRPQTAAIFVTLDAVVASKAELATALAELTSRSRHLTAGLAPDPGDPLFPPPESGIIGPTVGPSDLTITVGFGASLFDGRFGLADRIPRQLVRMPDFRNDRIQADLAHGDLLLQICATDEASCLHALRYLMLGTRGSLVIRWLIHGFQQRPGGAIEHGGTPATRRNLLGFKDGTPTSARPTRRRWTSSSGSARARASPTGRSAAPTWSPARSGCSSSAGIARRSASRRRSSAARSGPARRSGKAREHDDPAYDEDPDGRADPARRPHPPGEPAHARDAVQPDPAPRLFVQPRVRRRRAARRGPVLRRVPARPRARLRRRSRTGCPASRSRSTSSRSAAATSSCRPGPAGLTPCGAASLLA